MKKFNGLVDFIGLNGYWIFFTLMWYLGISYTGLSDSHLYLCFWIFVTLLTIYQIFKSIFTRKAIQKSLIISIFIILTLVCMFLFVDMIKSEFFNRFMGMCIPAIFLGVNCAFNQNEKKCMHYFEYLLVLSIIPFLLVLKDFMQTTGWARYKIESGSNSMGTGYSAVIFFVYLIMVMTLNRDKEKNKYQNKLIENIIRNKVFFTLSLILLFVIILSTGSRGPILAAFISPLLLIWVSGIRINKNIVKILFVMLFLSLCLIYLVNNNPFHALDYSIMRIKRLFEGIQGGDLVTASVGRNFLYGRAINLITQKPIMGNGFLSFIKEYGTYPHNIFLDILTSFGIFGFGILSICFIYLIIGIIKRVKNNINQIPFYSIIVVEIVKLLFSGTYINSYILFFLIGYGLSCRFDNSKRTILIKKTTL